MTADLSGSRVALLVSPRGTEEPEFTQPRDALRDAGADVDVISLEEGEAKTVNSDLDPGGAYTIDLVVGNADPADYVGVVIPGGTVGADTLRGDADIVAFVRSFIAAGKPVASICHGPWVLVEAGVLDGRRLTSYPTLRTDITNAGGVWVDAEVVVDQGLVTSRNPDDLPAFCAKIVEEISEGRHTGQSRGA